jgi:hypothetical protein
MILHKNPKHVIPAQAGIQRFSKKASARKCATLHLYLYWTPAFAGVTNDWRSMHG